jgi:hypothetical protein
MLRWLNALQAAALGSSLLHSLVDVYVGLFGNPQAMTAGRVAVLLSLTALYAWWGYVMSEEATERGTLISLLMLASVWAFFANGLIGFVVCWIPCPGAAPLGDVAHGLSLVFGALASVATWRELRLSPGPAYRWPAAVTAALIAVSFIFQATNVRLPT